MITLKDVAKHAGVSMATVSRVINSAGNVTENSKEKVLKAVEELGYYSNELARALRQERINVVSVVIPNIDNLFFAEMLQGIDDVLSVNGYHILFNNTDSDSAIEKQCIKDMRSMGLAGNLVFHSNGFDEEWAILAKSMPQTVLLSGRYGTEMPHLIPLPLDLSRSMENAIEYLASHGNKVVWVFSDQDDEKKQSYTQLATSIKEKYNCDLRFCFSIDIAKDAYRECKKCFIPGTKSAFLTKNDIQALGVLAWLNEAGASIPDEVEIISFGNTSLAQSAIPEISSVGPSGYSIGIAGAKMLLSQIAGKDNGGESEFEEMKKMLAPSLIIRGTCR